ncbi:MAG: hypothetical protein JWN48_3531 [Myxococcaceae bacterium]|nr:hypothetical protein [Myxococcaceae bacterium]
MTSRFLPGLSALLVPAVCLTLQASSAAANTCGGEASARWVPQRSWPAACEPDVTTDGLVLLEGDELSRDAQGGDGELSVTIQRIVQGNPVETFAGKVSHPDATSALFQSEKPLAPQADYQITAVRLGPDGSELGNKFTSAFTTGTRTLAPLALTGAPTLRYEEAETERYDCVTDECGHKNCQPGDDLVHVKSVRVAVPPIAGGVDIKPYSVSARLVASFSNGQAPAVATSDTAATQAGKRSFIVLELPALPAAAEGCVTISATDVAGHTLESEPVCIALQADDAPYDLEDESIPVLSELGLWQSTQAASDRADVRTTSEAATDTTTVEASAQGCAVGTSKASLGGLGWLSVVLTLARLRSRKSARRAS